MRTRARRFRSVVGAIVALIVVVPLAVAVKRTTVQAKVRVSLRPDSPPETSAERPLTTVVGAVLAQPDEVKSTATSATEHGGPHAKRQAIEYDRRSFHQMGDAWLM